MHEQAHGKGRGNQPNHHLHEKQGKHNPRIGHEIGRYRKDDVHILEEEQTEGQNKRTDRDQHRKHGGRNLGDESVVSLGIRLGHVTRQGPREDSGKDGDRQNHVRDQTENRDLPGPRHLEQVLHDPQHDGNIDQASHHGTCRVDQ